MINSIKGDIIFAYQEKQLGTAHAVMYALPHIPDYCHDEVILCGDVPLLTPDTVHRLLNDHIKAKRDITILATEVDNPQGYGRILLDNNRNVTGIVEETDATDEQKGIKIINTGIYCINKEILFDFLQKIKPSNEQGEFYLTDIVELCYNARKAIGAVVEQDFEEFVGVNTHQDLKAAEKIMRKRLGPEIL